MGTTSVKYECRVLDSVERANAAALIRAHHYTHCVPSGKSWYMVCGAALVVWAIPANRNIGKFLFGERIGKRSTGVLELARLWAPDNHDRNLLSRAISAATREIQKLENVAALVSYADPNAGHTGGVYRAANWIFTGASEESRVYVDGSGQSVARRAFHSGKRALTKCEIEALGYRQLNLPGKLRFVFPVERWARVVIENRFRENSGNGGINGKTKAA